MARQLRDINPGDLLHIYNRGARGQAVFLTEEDRRLFLALLATYAKRHGVEVVAYCLMGNHYHLIVRCADDAAAVSKMMRDFTSAYVQRFNCRHDFDGPLCMDRFSSKRVCSLHYLKYLSAYIHFNPRHIGWQRDLERYPWSSYHGYLHPTRRPEWLHVAPILSHFTGPTDYREYVERHDPMGMPADLTPDELFERVSSVDIAAILDIICTVAKTDRATLRDCTSRAAGRARMLAASLLVDVMEVPPSKVAQVLHLAGDRAVHSLVYRSRPRTVTDAAFRKLLHECVAAICAEPALAPVD